MRLAHPIIMENSEDLHISKQCVDSPIPDHVNKVMTLVDREDVRKGSLSPIIIFLI